MNKSDDDMIAQAREEFASGRVLALREATGHTRAELAAEVGVSVPSWVRWERGETGLRSRNALAVARILERLHAEDVLRVEHLRLTVLARIDALLAAPGVVAAPEPAITEWKAGIARQDAEGLQRVLDSLRDDAP